ncbi:NADH-quinone oxidoreductase subunit NuoG [Cereibacter changlensis]|uniref:NADH-quinone oxidoreductase subunit NuoG n=1 Tax=Cereibacter changlensis TaxID=402884 RepID=UPI0040346F7B
MKLTLNGREIEAEAGRDLLTTCLENGVDVPHFCWHGDLGSVGACRLCAVRVYDGPEDQVGRIEMSCMTPAKEGQRVETADPEAEAFRAHVIEWTMLNHPHDCAVCEEAGACHLQDMTVATGHHTRRSTAPKRTHRNQDLGPLLTHEMNRCIACYRCVRFYRDYAGGADLEVFGAHDRVYFGRAADGALESPFAGNLAELCPTGVFNDKHWSQHYARRWDMRATPSICAHCAVGCNVTLFERGGTLRQVQNRYHGAVNGSFLCDRGRFGMLHAEAPRPLPRVDGAVVTPEAALEAARALLPGAIGIGSPRASVEANFALRDLVGADRFFAGVTEAEAALVGRMAAILAAGPARIASVKDIESADAALILGEDLTGTAPRAALALRVMARGAARDLAAEKGVPAWMEAAARVAGEGRRSPVALVTPLPDALDPLAELPLRRTPEEIGHFGQAVAAVLRGGESGDPEVRAVAALLRGAKAPLVIAGAGLGLAGPVEAAAAIALALGPKARLALFAPEANSMGLALLGAPGLEGAVAALEAAPAPVIVLENDLSRRAPVERLMAAATQVIALDSLETPLTARADLVLPVAAQAEAAGTFVNHEGRAQRFFAGSPSELPAAWRLLATLGGKPSDSFDALLARIAAEIPALAGILDAAPAADAGPIPRATARCSGRTADDLAGRVAEGQPHNDPDSPFVWSMEGRAAPPALLPAPQRPGMHSVSAVYQAMERIGGPLKGGDPGGLAAHPQRPGRPRPAGCPTGWRRADPPAAARSLPRQRDRCSQRHPRRPRPGPPAGAAPPRTPPLWASPQAPRYASTANPAPRR